MNILLFIFALLFSIWYFTRGQKLLESENEPVITILNKVFFLWYCDFLGDGVYFPVLSSVGIIARMGAPVQGLLLNVL